MQVVISSSPEYEEVFAEIGYRDVYWARITYNQQERRFILHIFPELLSDEHGDLHLDVTEVQAALERAKVMLREYGQVPE